MHNIARCDLFSPVFLALARSVSPRGWMWGEPMGGPPDRRGSPSQRRTQQQTNPRQKQELPGSQQQQGQLTGEKTAKRHNTGSFCETGKEQSFNIFHFDPQTFQRRMLVVTPLSPFARANQGMSLFGRCRLCLQAEKIKSQISSKAGAEQQGAGMAKHTVGCPGPASVT